MSWYQKAIKNYVNFSGRARRKEFWLFMLFNAIILGILGVISLILAGNESTQIIGVIFSVLAGIYGLFVLLPMIAVYVRRLHDSNKSGWWFLLLFIPVVDIVLLVFLCMPGTAGSNRFGDDPKA